MIDSWISSLHFDGFDLGFSNDHYDYWIHSVNPFVNLGLLRIMSLEVSIVLSKATDWTVKFAEGGQDTVLSSVLREGSGLGQPQDCPEVVLRLSCSCPEAVLRLSWDSPETVLRHNPGVVWPGFAQNIRVIYNISVSASLPSPVWVATGTGAWVPGWGCPEVVLRLSCSCPEVVLRLSWGCPETTLRLS